MNAPSMLEIWLMPQWLKELNTLSWILKKIHFNCWTLKEKWKKMSTCLLKSIC
jgi:hypothetical protein